MTFIYSASAQHALAEEHLSREQVGVPRTFLLLVLMGGLLGCGGAGSSKGSQNPPSPPPNLGGGAVSQPIAVAVGAGQTVSGINITVTTPASNPPPNAEVLGVANLTGAGQAFNTGGALAQGASNRVLLFGPGLSGAMIVTITGPVGAGGATDITVSDVQSITATDNTPGISFEASVSPSASLGCRTVVLRAPNGDVTTFTGGLEVVP